MQPPAVTAREVHPGALCLAAPCRITRVSGCITHLHAARHIQRSGGAHKQRHAAERGETLFRRLFINLEQKLALGWGALGLEGPLVKLCNSAPIGFTATLSGPSKPCPIEPARTAEKIRTDYGSETPRES